MKDIENIRQVFAEKSQAEILERDSRLRRDVAYVLANSHLRTALRRRQLIELGLKLIDDSGNCPLCDKEWESGELAQYLNIRIEQAGNAESIRGNISNAAREIREAIDSLIPSIKSLASGSTKLERTEEAAQFTAWLERLEWLDGVLKNPVEELIPSNLSTKQVTSLLGDEAILQACHQLTSIINERFPDLTAEQKAWEILIRVEENLKALENENEVFILAKAAQLRAQVLLNSFQSARDKVLGTLFENVKERFAEMYRQIHGTDEDSFIAKLEHVKAGLNLEVDFHGLGTHPPQALHSEGHQDTMGICLYLALAELLTNGVIDIVILDDVVMSVDAEHRRELCKLFQTAFPHKQFIITTHDKTWANQLKYQGVVQSKGLKEFYSWQLDRVRLFWDDAHRSLYQPQMRCFRF